MSSSITLKLSDKLEKELNASDLVMTSGGARPAGNTKAFIKEILYAK